MNYQVFGVFSMKKNRLLSSRFGPYLIGLLLFLVLMLIFLSATAFLASRDGAPDSLAPILSYAFLGISVLVSAAVCAAMKKKSGWLSGLCQGGLCFLFLFLVSMIVRGASFDPFTWKTLIYLLAGAILSALGGILGVNLKKKR